MKMSNKDNLFLHQLSWECPGLHGKGTRQDISRQTFAQVFEKYPKLIIPLFQRRYCWQESQFEGWWNDAYRGKRDHLGLHNSGNVVVKPINDELIIIDGQQRITTTLLLLSALKSHLTKKDSQKEIQKVLRDGKDVDWRLIPSYLDRQAFYSIMSSNETFTEEEKESKQWKAFTYFKAKASRLNQDGLEEMFRNALHKMSMTLVVVVNDINFSQVFLWLQEKSLFRYVGTTNQIIFT